MTLTEMFTICDSCVYAPCLCGSDPENCVAYVMRTFCGAKMDLEDENEKVVETKA